MIRHFFHPLSTPDFTPPVRDRDFQGCHSGFPGKSPGISARTLSLRKRRNETPLRKTLP